MSLFKPFWRKDKKTEIKIDELNEDTDILDSIERFNNVLKNPLVTLATKEEILNPDFDLIQTDPYPLYINTKTNDMYISYDNKKTFEQVNIQKAFDMVTGVDLDTATITDAVGTPCHGTFNKNYQLQVEAPTVTTLENELKKRLEELESKLAKTVSLVHNCANCGATLELEENKAIIHCKYCGSTYIVGPARLNSHY